MGGVGVVSGVGGVGEGAEMWCPDRPLFCMSNFLIVPNLIKNK